MGSISQTSAGIYLAGRYRYLDLYFDGKMPDIKQILISLYMHRE